METPREPESSPPDAAPSSAALPHSPLCIHLRSKKVYFLPGRPQSSEDVLDGSGHCWCTRTMMAHGPDEERVDPDRCRAGRGCFESTT